MKISRPLLAGLLLAACAVPPAHAKFMTGGPKPQFAENPMSDLLQTVGLDQKLNQQLPLDVPFRDEAGNTVTLAAYVKDKPVLLNLVYYECPMLCNLLLNGLNRSLRVLSFDVGREFDIITLSFDPTETPALAVAKKATYIKEYGRSGAGEGWHFLTGPEESIRAVTEAVGFRYRYVEERDEYAHTAGLMVLTPSGRISRYFYGVEFAARDLRLALVEASAGRIGNPVDQVLLWCFHYDPVMGKYGFAIQRALQVGGLLTVGVVGGFMAMMLRRERRLRAVGAM
jgi:protein SCO1/2